MNDTPSVAYLAYIPAQVRYHDTLSANAKIFYAEITALCHKYGYCFASNTYFAEQFKMSDRTVTRLISELEKYHFIRVKIVKNAQTGMVLGRRIYPDIVADELVPDGDIITIAHPTKLSGPPDKIVIDQSPNMSTGSYIKNNNNKEENTRAKKQGEKDALKELCEWAYDRFGDEASLDLIPCLTAYCQARMEWKKPLPAGRAVTTLTNKLVRLSGGQLPVMIAMLDKALLHKWLGVYALKDDELADVPCNGTSDHGGEDGGIPWL